MTHSSTNTENGFVALVSVLIVGAIGATIAVGLLAAGGSWLETKQAQRESAAARYLADACGEYALEKYRQNSAYAGTEVVPVGDENCTIRAVFTDGSGNKVIQTQAIVGSSTRRVEIRVGSRTPRLTISSWQEVADF
jgi:hypothetical protein